MHRFIIYTTLILTSCGVVSDPIVKQPLQSLTFSKRLESQRTLDDFPTSIWLTVPAELENDLQSIPKLHFENGHVYKAATFNHRAKNLWWFDIDSWPTLGAFTAVVEVEQITTEVGALEVLANQNTQLQRTSPVGSIVANGNSFVDITLFADHSGQPLRDVSLKINSMGQETLSIKSEAGQFTTRLSFTRTSLPLTYIATLPGITFPITFVASSQDVQLQTVAASPCQTSIHASDLPLPFAVAASDQQAQSLAGLTVFLSSQYHVLQPRLSHQSTDHQGYATFALDLANATGGMETLSVHLGDQQALFTCDIEVLP